MTGIEIKNIAVVAGEDYHDIAIRPGTTAEDIIAQLNLPKDYWLSKRGGDFFGLKENVFGQLEDGEKIFCSPPANVALAF